MSDNGKGSLNVVLAGVGGQGTLLAADVVALVGLAQGLDVKKSEVHGMAQRGGSVISHVRWGERVYSPLIAPGEVDLLVAFERLEALRYAELLRPGGALLVNDYRIVPVTVTSGDGRYPAGDEEEAAFAGAAVRRFVIPAMRIAQEVGQARVNNVVMLGAASALLDVPEGVWRDVIAERVPERYVELNLRAFEAGRAQMERGGH
ncbi:MAG TPA: indolepyruvate oxidoreductase subunit beta [Armatimonadota bacterium]|nr:indolepyruvate oxidoreductase subunit beta [Armatimonadota bacterium]